MNFSGVVLAGGKSRRMGFPKHLIEIDGVPLWRRQMDLLCLAGARSTALSLAAAQASPDPEAAIVRDTFQDCGPLGGIAAALAWSQEPLVLVLAVDLPLMTMEAIHRIVEACDENCGCVPFSGEYVEPLAAMYPRSAISLLNRKLETGQFAAHGFVRECVSAGLARILDFPPGGVFENMNSLKPHVD